MSLEVRVLRLEADVEALTQDRKWLVEIVAGLAVHFEGQR